MKNKFRHIIAIALILLVSTGLRAQKPALSMNVDDYSGKMYVIATETWHSPKYFSFVYHGEVTKDISIPAGDNVVCRIDFRKGTVTSNGETEKIEVNFIERFTTDNGAVVIINMNVLEKDGRKAELYWPQNGSPRFREMIKEEGQVKLVDLVLAREPGGHSDNKTLEDTFLHGMKGMEAD